MMKRTLIVAVAMALVTSSAMAASLYLVAPLGTATSSQIRAITNDGAIAIGYGGGGTADRAFLWTAGGGTTGPMLAGSYMAEGNGIAYRTNPTTLAQELVIGGKQSSGQVGMFVSTDVGATWTRPFASAGSAPGVGATNAVGGNGAGVTDHAWMSWAEGTTAYSVTRIHGDPITTGTATKSATTSVYVTGMSNVGRASGMRKNTSGARQNVYLDFTTDGGTATQNIFAGLDGTTVGQAGAMSGNGSYVFGQSPKIGGFSTAVNYPYKYTVGGSIAELPLLPGTTGSVSLGYIYGASEDGRYAVGMDYVGMERAALWDTVAGTVTDLTTLASGLGILDGFTGNLRRGYSIGVNGSGQPVIAGMGIWDDPATTAVETLTRGFVLTIPEPATLTFLALGGLAMLRRRRA